MHVQIEINILLQLVWLIPKTFQIKIRDISSMNVLNINVCYTHAVCISCDLLWKVLKTCLDNDKKVSSKFEISSRCSSILLEQNLIFQAYRYILTSSL